MDTGGVTVRTIQDGDQQAIAYLRRATAKADVTDEGLVIVEPPPDTILSGSTPKEGTLVVQDSEGCLLATAQLQVDIGTEQSFVWSFPVVHPRWRGSNIERLLLEGLWKLARERRSEIPDGQTCFFVHCGSHQKEGIALYESPGLRLMRQRPHMVYHHLDGLPSPLAPSHMQLRPYSRGQDDQSALDTLNQAFADDWEYDARDR